MITVLQFFKLKGLCKKCFKIFLKGNFWKLMFYWTKVYLKTWKKYVLSIFYIFKYILKINFIYNVLFLLILYICIIIFSNNLEKTIKSYFENTKFSIFYY